MTLSGPFVSLVRSAHLPACCGQSLVSSARCSVTAVMRTLPASRGPQNAARVGTAPTSNRPPGATPPGFQWSELLAFRNIFNQTCGNFATNSEYERDWILSDALPVRQMTSDQKRG
jgi:hypothetical protein